MTRIVVAHEAGACYGVERALRMAQQATREARGPVFTLGPLIHNPSVVATLERDGVGVAHAPHDVPAGSTLLLRTHGVTPAVEQNAKDAQLEVLDATCPFVKRVHTAVERLEHEGYQVLVAGEKGHPEVEGTLGHSNDAQVVGSADDLVSMEVSKRVGLVAQTTLAHALLAEIAAALVIRCDDLRVINTICAATSERQAAADELARKADVMLVIGGRNSANTRHLADICHARCARTHHIELPAEIDPTWIEDAELVGITAGASTPASQIDEVRSCVEMMCGR